MNIKEFERHCRDNVQPRQGDEYISGQLLRLYEVYSTILDFVDEGDQILSVGAGAAYVETALARSRNVSVTVADFPEAIDTYRRLYERFDVRPVGCDLTDSQPISEELEVDVVLSCEVMEHLVESPFTHINKLTTYLTDDGILYLTTPNLARLRVIVLLILGQTYLPPPEKYFSDIRFENEGVHRREYVMSELKTAVTKTELELMDTGYIFKRAHDYRDWRLWLLYPIEKAIPRYRPIQYLVARK